MSHYKAMAQKLYKKLGRTDFLTLQILLDGDANRTLSFEISVLAAEIEPGLFGEQSPKIKKLIADAAEAVEVFGDDELERHELERHECGQRLGVYLKNGSEVRCILPHGHVSSCSSKKSRVPA